MILKNFEVDIKKYHLSEHDCLLTTTEYTYGNTCLSKQVIHKKLRGRILRRLKSADTIGLTPEREQYYISKTYSGKCRKIGFTTFIKKLNESDQNEIKIVQESYEQFYYQDRKNKPASVGIAVFKEGDKLTKATIEFQDKDEMETFILPEWLYQAD